MGESYELYDCVCDSFVDGECGGSLFGSPTTLQVQYVGRSGEGYSGSGRAFTSVPASWPVACSR